MLSQEREIKKDVQKLEKDFKAETDQGNLKLIKAQIFEK